MIDNIHRIHLVEKHTSLLQRDQLYFTTYSAATIKTEEQRQHTKYRTNDDTNQPGAVAGAGDTIFNLLAR